MIIARAETPAGEVALRRRDGVDELVVNGVFAMDSAEVTSELALADAAGSPPGRVLAGGLGLGYTAARLLDAGAERVRVVELAEPLLEWARAGLTEQLYRVATDPRVELVAGDIAEQVEGRWDAILLDVDNGPGSMVHEGNHRLYGHRGIAACRIALAEGGVLAVWSAHHDEPYLHRLEKGGFAATARVVPARGPAGGLKHVLFIAVKAAPVRWTGRGGGAGGGGGASRKRPSKAGGVDRRG